MSVLLGDLRASSHYPTAWMSRAVNDIQFARYLLVSAEQLCALCYPQGFPSQRDGASLTPMSVELLHHVRRTGSRV